MIAAMANGRNVIGIESNPDMLAMTDIRITGEELHRNVDEDEAAVEDDEDSQIQMEESSAS